MKTFLRSHCGLLILIVAAAVLGLSSASCFGPRILLIGVIAPLEAGQVEFGRGIRNAVQLAIDEANAAGGPWSWGFLLAEADDSSDPATGAAAAQTLAADPRVVGVVGPYNSGVAAEAAPILEAAGIALISPGNTDPALTLGDDLENPARPHDNYFRVVASDADQGPFLAHYAYDVMQVRNAAVVTETKAVSKGLADAFTAAFELLGGTVLITEDLQPGTTDYGPALARVAAAEPELVFFGGEYEVGAAVRLQALAQDIQAPMMGGDGLKAPAYIDAVGAGCEGDIASSVGAPIASLPAGPAFLAAYNAAGFQDPPSDFGPYAYDAANILIAQARACPARDRECIRMGVQQTAADGVTGPIAFDAFGDTTNPVFTAYKVVDGVWAAQED